MNRAYLLIGIPAFVTSFLWLAFGWGWWLAAVVTGAELGVVLLGVLYLLRRQNARARGTETSR